MKEAKKTLLRVIGIMWGLAAASYAGVGTKSDQPADIIIEFLFSTVFLPGYGVCGIVCHQGGGTPVSGHFPGKTGSGGINYTQTFV